MDEEVADHVVTDAREHALGVELDALDGILPVSDAHDEFRSVVVGRGRHGEAVGHLGRDERVVAAGLEALVQPRKDAGVVVVDDNVVYFEEDDDIELSYGGSNITLTNSSGHSWPAGAELTVQLGQATSDTVTVIAQAAEADLGGSLTGTTDGSLADISDVDIASAASDSANPTAAEIDTAVNAAIAEANLQIKELQTKVNSLLAKLRTAGIIDTA